MWLHLFDRGLAESLATDSGGIMNPKEEIQKDFLRLQKILRELRFLRYSYFGDDKRKKQVEDIIHTLGPWSDELKAKLDSMTKPGGDYDI